MKDDVRSWRRTLSYGKNVQGEFKVLLVQSSIEVPECLVVEEA